MNTQEWPARPFIFAVIGALSAVGIHLLIDKIKPAHSHFDLKISIAAFIVAFSAVFAVTAHRHTLLRCILYALIVALVTGAICYWRLFIRWPDAFSFVALAVTIFVLTPFFQSSLQNSFRDYKALHHFAWGNLLVGGLAVLFMGLSFALAHLLASLFSLVGIDFIKTLLREDLFVSLLLGTALGAAVGVLREHDAIVSSTQSVVQSVFSLFVTPLALGLAGFIAVLPFTGLTPLWDSTRNTSATLFACAAFALIVVNAVIREDVAGQSRNRIVLIAARVLAITIAPLAAVAVVAIKLRVEQHGWTPDRLWAAVICALLLAYSLCYVIAAFTKVFPAFVRSANLYLALMVCALALVLATPLFDFGAVSTKDQLNRLSEGVISEDKLDLTAMAFDFGPTGREALESLKSNASAQFATRIAGVLGAENRWQSVTVEAGKSNQNVKDKLKVSTPPWTVPEDLLKVLQRDTCKYDGYCHLYISDSRSQALVLDQLCYGNGQCQPRVNVYRLHKDRWQLENAGYANGLLEKDANSRGVYLEQLDLAARAGKLELKPVERMQLFIGDEPFGQVIE